MLIDGLTLAHGSGFSVRMLDDARRGNVLPDSAISGQLFEITESYTEQDGTYVVAGVYEGDGYRWFLVNPSYSVLTYDISGTVFGQPKPDAHIVYYVAPRTFYLNPGLVGCIARTQVEPLQTLTFDINVERVGQPTKVGEMTFHPYQTEGTFTPASNEPIRILRGDVLTVTAPSLVDSQASNISFTLCGYISA